MGQRVEHLKKMLDASVLEKVMISSQLGVRQNIAEVIKARLRGKRIIREINEWPLSVTWHESKLKQWVEINLLPKLFDGFICISDELVRFCRANGRKQVPIFKLPMTVDFEEVEQLGKDVHADSSKDTFLIVYVGSMTEAKDGVETLKRAVELVKAKHPLVQLELVNGVSHEDAVRKMYAADLLALARPDSQQARAGFPTKLGEYLATGRPVVVTKVGEIPRYLKDGVSAFLAEPGSAESFAEKIEAAINNWALAEKVGLAGREVAREKFDYRVHAQALDEWLKQFI